jgi:hypothetical protein
MFERNPHTQQIAALMSDSVVAFLMFLFIVQNLACCSYCSTFAQAKNLKTSGWAIGGLLLGPLALIAVAGMPIATPLPVVKTQGWACPQCKEKNPSENDHCWKCKTKRI